MHTLMWLCMPPGPLQILLELNTTALLSPLWQREQARGQSTGRGEKKSHAPALRSTRRALSIILTATTSPVSRSTARFTLANWKEKNAQALNVKRRPLAAPRPRQWCPATHSGRRLSESTWRAPPPVQSFIGGAAHVGSRPCP